MATYTEHYNLIKPALNDKVNINNLNDNADIIDAALNNKVDTDDTQNITTSANNCMMSDGVTSVEDAVDGLTALPKIKYFNVTVPVSVTSYNYETDKPSDFSLPLTAFSVQGGGAQITQISATTMYFLNPMQNQGTIRVLYVAT